MNAISTGQKNFVWDSSGSIRGNEWCPMWCQTHTSSYAWFIAILRQNFDAEKGILSLH